MLASQGNLSVALNYLTVVGFEKLSQNSLILLDRVYGAKKIPNAGYPFPFQKVDIGPIAKPEPIVENIVTPTTPPNVFPVNSEVTKTTPVDINNFTAIDTRIINAYPPNKPANTNLTPPNNANSGNPIMFMPADFNRQSSITPTHTDNRTVTTPQSKELSPEAKAIIDNLSGILTALINQLTPTDPRKKLTEDASKRLNELFQKLTKNDIPQSQVTKLHQITTCIAAGDYAGADALIKQYWTELGSHTLLGPKRLIEVALKNNK